ncbi:proteinase inhibitor kazal [Colletotrichum truncatum]|uniref:Proteinase inhibitor kazal n=1 Tax=Colletotrichum truncatum TaxID=5467 RepID=A0ACC3YL75_COLTU|nr:proteinase inhibitor kazal [Colletotrichum truncatum]KAF6782642.1 proteinase inhibitor kazal [Colletotrichum truncatum]
MRVSLAVLALLGQSLLGAAQIGEEGQGLEKRVIRVSTVSGSDIVYTPITFYVPTYRLTHTAHPPKPTRPPRSKRPTRRLSIGRPTKTRKPPALPSKTRTYSDCGGFRPTPPTCAEGYTCVDDPWRGGCGMACDWPGICMIECGGFLGKACPKGMECLDRPGDGCDPQNGGADCMGLCF